MEFITAYSIEKNIKIINLKNFMELKILTGH